MRRIFLTFCLACYCSAVPLDVAVAEEATVVKKTSYAIGVLFGIGLRTEGLSVYADVEEVTRGLRDALSAKKPPLTESEARAIVDRFQTELEKHKEEEARGKEEKLSEEAAQFLQENARKVAVTVLPSGLQYRVLEEGVGNKPGTNDVIRAWFTGKLLDGTEFQSAVKPGFPNGFFQLSQNNLIPGLREALGLMRVGDRWEIVVPPPLGFGSPPYGSKIPPNAALIYDLKVLSLEPAKDQGKTNQVPVVAQ